MTRRFWRRAMPAAAVSLLVSVFVAGCGAGPPGDVRPFADRASYHIGVLQIDSAAVIDATVRAFRDELSRAMAPKPVTFDVINAQGDQSLIASAARDLAGSDDDALAVIGTPAVIALARQETRRPIFALAIGDPVGAGVATSLERPGGNVTGSIDYVDPARLLDPIMTIRPAPTRLGTVYDPSNQNMVIWIDALRRAVAAHPGLQLVEATISGSADIPSGARSLVGRADAVLVGPDAAVLAGLPAVGSTVGGAGVPVYVCGGDANVDGVLASIGPDYPTLGVLAAQAAARVLTGTPVSEVPFGRPTGITFAINKKTMNQLGLSFPQAILSTATVR
ncbi:ABC transporter substrate-binding protein [Pseudonocardia alaniniphila]|uniref:ABC transporter substrate-binding protein n=1 Tax=Pseudonocardia alaniniphila TaxID=75291 RepID=A0ABS9TVB2_9PSEU|nr:ABC transporter substrate-binding protein [Pseudonocardia alaniniphila]MCH6172298.1 ABC transporter substrate-binding protein [Pseudonocardia alaniniphila]